MATQLNLDYEMIERMELDLATKCQAAITTAAIDTSVYGVFSVDDLSTKSQSDLCSKMAVGVGYDGAIPIDQNQNIPGNPGSFNAARMVNFRFTIILAVPSGEDCLERYSATKLLTALRRGIMGSKVSGDMVNRTWEFVQEAPQPSASTKSMIFYTQLWQVKVPITGPTVN